MTYSIEQAKEQIIRAGKELLDAGLIARTWGNISARISATQFLVTPSGRAYDSLKPEDIVLVNIADGKVPKGVETIKPSSEKGVHAAVYRQRPGVNFVIHTHQDYATAISILGRQFRLKNVKPEAKKVLGPFIPTARYALSSTKALESHVITSIRKYPQAKSVLLRNHGTVCMGADYDDAFAIARTLEEICRMKYEQLIGSDGLQDQTGSEADQNRVFDRVLRREIHEEYDEHYRAFENGKTRFLIETSTPCIVRAASYGRDIKAYVDDLAQIAGTAIRCLPEDASEQAIAKALGSGACGAVLIRGKGAICAGGTEEDAEAVAILLEKGCMAALLAQKVKAGSDDIPDSWKAKGVPKTGGKIEHIVYTQKYSKLKDQGEETC